MSIYDSIKNFPKQFDYEPVIENNHSFKFFNKFVVVGMGGSGLTAGLLKVFNPSIDLIAHNDYGLPEMLDLINAPKNRLVILSSYSGNTEETISAFQEAYRLKLNCAVISTGGKLLELAQNNNIPFIRIPNMGIQPRMANGFNLKALLKFVNEDQILLKAKKLSSILKSEDFEENGKDMARTLKGFIPVIYSSFKNAAIAYNWKIKFNETGKIPAFYNVFPELNHNEMTGFDVVDSTKALSEKLFFIILRDSEDGPRIVKRMNVLAGLYRDRKLPVLELDLDNESGILYKVFSSLILADWASYYLATEYGVEPEQVPMVEEFKKLIAM